MIDEPYLIGGDDRAKPTGFWRGNGEWHALFEPSAPTEPDEPSATPREVGPTPATDMVEICRSFSYKLNLSNYGGPQYESADFFCSRKMQCHVEAHALVSQTIFEECFEEVRATKDAFIASMQHRIAESRRRGEEERAREREAAESYGGQRPASHPTSTEVQRRR